MVLAVDAGCCSFVRNEGDKAGGLPCLALRVPREPRNITLYLNNIFIALYL
jgi:hypothetical protein